MILRDLIKKLGFSIAKHLVSIAQFSAICKIDKSCRIKAFADVDFTGA